MDPTLRSGELLVVVRPLPLKVAALIGGRGGARSGESLAARGAVLVLPEPGRAGVMLGLLKPLIVKRAVGLPGESIALARGQLLIDGVAVEEPWLAGGGSLPSMRPRQVPAGHVFLLGDNRRPLASSDSRQFGPQPLSVIRGRALYRLRAPWGAAGLRSPLTPLR